MTDASTAAFPQLGSPFVFTDGPQAGQLTVQGYRLLLALYNRTGGSSPSLSSDDLQLLSQLPAIPQPSVILQAEDTAMIALLEQAITASRRAAAQSQTTGINSATVTAFTGLSSGTFVNIFASGGIAQAQYASATDLTKPCHAFVAANATAGQSVIVYFGGQIAQGLAGLTPGFTYWLSTTAGTITATPPSASGNGTQMLGEAVTPTSLAFFPQPMIGI